MTRHRHLHLNLFLSRNGHHNGAWRRPEADPRAVFDLGYYVRLAQLAERGLLDSVFLSDVLHLSSSLGPTSSTEPLTTLSALAAVTEHIGLIGTASTTYGVPFHLARQFASLDHLSGGRAGWNIVTSRHDDEGRNFGIERHPDHDERYERAAEFIKVATSLWDGWPEDAIVADKATGRYLDRGRIKALDHNGAFYRVAGPLNLPRPPQGRPILVQAGASAQGRDLAARYADAIFTVQPTFETAKTFYDDIKARTAASGRDPGAILLLPGAYTVIGTSAAEVDRLEDELASFIDFEAQRASLSGLIGVDLSGLNLDAPVGTLSRLDDARSSKAFYEVFAGLSADGSTTLRDILRRSAAGAGHFQAIGTPDQVADQFEHWFVNGAADGFNLKPSTLPEGLEIFVEEVVPRLQKKGLFRERYAENTLRGNLGLPLPNGAAA